MFFKIDFPAKPVTSEEPIYSEVDIQKLNIYPEVEYIFPKFIIFVFFTVQKAHHRTKFIFSCVQWHNWK